MLCAETDKIIIIEKSLRIICDLDDVMDFKILMSISSTISAYFTEIVRSFTNLS